MRLRIDTKSVAGLALAAGQNELFAWDTELEGFGFRLRRGADGVRTSYVAQYRAGGRTRRVRLGSTELTPTQARGLAGKVLAKVRLGGDPQAERQAKREQSALTLKSVAGEYLADRQAKLRPVSYRIANLYLTGSYYQPLHAKPVAEITRADVASRVTAIKRSHSEFTAAAARRQLSSLFAWAMGQGYVDRNPVIGTNKPANPKARERVLTDAELVAIWNACRGDDHGRIARLLILLGARRQEVGGMCWSEIDLDAGTWSLPAERSKNHKAITVSLPAAAVEIIAGVPRTRDHVFGERGFTSWTRGKKELDARLDGAVKAWRLHDIRRTVATGMINTGIEPHHVEACLNHHSGHRAGVAGVYNKSDYGPQIKNALARWADHVLALVEGREDKVVPLRRA